MFSEVLQPLGIIIFCRQPMQCTIIFTASYMFSFWKCGYQANAKNTRKTLNVVRLMQVCRGSSMIWLYSSRTAFHHGICWMSNECQGDYYIIAYKKSETFFFLWNGVLTSRVMRNPGTLCLSPCEWEGSAWTCFYSETSFQRKLWSGQKWATHPSLPASSGGKRMSPAK